MRLVHELLLTTTEDSKVGISQFEDTFVMSSFGVKLVVEVCENSEPVVHVLV